jgi:hypothetical protein
VHRASRPGKLRRLAGGLAQARQNRTAHLDQVGLASGGAAEDERGIAETIGAIGRRLDRHAARLQRLDQPKYPRFAMAGTPRDFGQADVGLHEPNTTCLPMDPY